MTQTEALIKRLTPLQFSSPSKIDWTSELGIILDYDLTAQAGCCPVCPSRGGSSKSGHPQTAPVPQQQQIDRLVAADFQHDRPTTGDKSTPPIKELPSAAESIPGLCCEDEKTPPPVPTHEPNKLLLKGVYRGQVLTREVPVDIHRVPHNTALEYPRPSKGTPITRPGRPEAPDNFSEDKACSPSWSTTRAC